jgi:cell division protein FtsZ
MKALASPLLNDNQISGARYVLLNITYGDQEVLMDEISEITDYIQDEAGNTADVIWGHGYDASLGDNLCITVIATGFKSTPDTGLPQREPAKRVMDLEEERPTIITQPIQSPTQTSVPKEENEKLEEVEEPFIVKKFNLEDDVLEDTVNEVEEPVQEDLGYTASEEVKENPVSESEDGKVRFMLEENDASTAEDIEEPVAETFNFTPTPDEPIVESNLDQPSVEDNRELTQQRLDRIRNTSKQIKTSMTLSDMENEPAYKRRNIQLDDVDHSSESTQSRFTIGDIENEDGEKRTGLSDNNSFLHDNVD